MGIKSPGNIYICIFLINSSDKGVRWRHPEPKKAVSLQHYIKHKQSYS